MTYSSKTWTGAEKQKTPINAMEMRIFRKIENKRGIRYIRNWIIRLNLKLETKEICTTNPIRRNNKWRSEERMGRKYTRRVKKKKNEMEVKQLTQDRKKWRKTYLLLFFVSVPLSIPGCRHLSSIFMSSYLRQFGCHHAISPEVCQRSNWSLSGT